MMFLLLLLIVAVAAFNIVSAQTMLVHEKRGDIAILRTMGASSGLIMRTVLMQGVVVALAGIGAGIVIGLVLAYSVTDVVQTTRTGTRRAPARRHLLRAGAVQSLPLDVMAIFLLSLSLCLASAAVPARRAAALNPAEALHSD